ncbi:hypothetical protein HN903_03715 [archaeon]|jgi:hypothetical protein|nr:hypothetical protein [archaeon]MBT7128837.1 hypothetical protein [archaeon]
MRFREGIGDFRGSEFGRALAYVDIGSMNINITSRTDSPRIKFYVIKDSENDRFAIFPKDEDDVFSYSTCGDLGKHGFSSKMCEINGDIVMRVQSLHGTKYDLIRSRKSPASRLGGTLE